MTKFDISIISDTVCPWCYLGLKRLQNAIALFQKTYPGGSKDEFNIAWLPYYLDQSPPPQSIPIRSRMITRMGEEQTEKIISRLIGIGNGEGIAFRFDGRIGSTRDSHRILNLAASKGGDSQTKVAEALFRGFFEEGRDITIWDELIELAVSGGLLREEARMWLENGRGSEVDEEEKKVREDGINGVPKFSINGQFVEGAQDAGDFFEIFLKAKEDGL